MYIYLVKQCVQKIKEIEAYDRSQNTRIIQVCCVGGGAVGGGEGVSATKRDTLSFKLEGKEGLGGGRGGVRWGLVVLDGQGGGFEGSQGPVPGLIFSHNVLTAAQLLPQVRYLHAESGVLLLQEGGADGDLVLLQPPGVP